VRNSTFKSGIQAFRFSLRFNCGWLLFYC